MRAMLEGAGHEVLEAPHGAAALEYLEGDLPDLVVTDLMMPVMDGLELVTRMRSDQRLALLPILVVSGIPDAVGVGGGADAVLAKPFIQAELLASVIEVLRVRAA